MSKKTAGISLSAKSVSKKTYFFTSEGHIFAKTFGESCEHPHFHKHCRERLCMIEILLA